MNTMDLQPILNGKLLKLRPLELQDFEALYVVASDPLIWELHPERLRYQRAVFEKFFQAALDSKGALVVLDAQTGEIIGSSRFTGLDLSQSVIEIGYTFLSRAYWGKGHNTEMKSLMLGHAFKYVKNVLFLVGEKNLRSRRAVEKLGAQLMDRVERVPAEGTKYTAVIYRLQPPEGSGSLTQSKV